MEILYKDKNLVAVFKPAGIPSQSDPSGDADAMNICIGLLKEQGEKNTELYLVHRLDRVVGGVIVFARNKSCAGRLSALISEKSAEKEYLAVVEGDAEDSVLTDFLYKDSRLGKAFVTDRKRAGVKEATLEYRALSKYVTESTTKTLIRVKLHTGRFHQIRAQLSYHNHPIVGDGKYGSHDNQAKFPALFAFRLAFVLDGKKYEFQKMPNIENYPWRFFKYD